MVLEREPEKPETENFQCPVPAADVRQWRTLLERASKQRVNLRKAFAKQFHTWLGEVESDLAAMAPVRPIRSKAEE